MFSCFDPITGGRVSEIVKQQNKSGCSWCLPLSQEEDKFEKFCNTYEGFIKVPSAYETFIEKWERAKSKNPPSSGDGKKSNILLGALVSSFWGDLLKAFIGKMTWSILVLFLVFYFCDLGLHQGQRPRRRPFTCSQLRAHYLRRVLCNHGVALHWYPTDGCLLQSLGMQGQGCPHYRHLQEDDCSRFL